MQRVAEGSVTSPPRWWKSHLEFPVYTYGDQGLTTKQQSGDLPCAFVVYTKSATASLSFIAMLLKCFRTAIASCSLGIFRIFFFLAIVGDLRPNPGAMRTAALRVE